MNNINTPTSGNQIKSTSSGWGSSLASYREKVRSRPRLAPPTRFWVFMVFAWAALTTVFVSQAISLSVPHPAFEDVDERALIFPIVELTGIWFAGTMLALIITLVRKKRFRRTFTRPVHVLSTFTALFVGWFMGSNVFALSFLDQHISASSSIFHDYPQLREEMKMWDYLPEDQKSVWFDEKGQLLSDQKQDWCANAVPRALTFADMSTNPGREGLAINALLTQGILTQLYKVDCLTFSEHTQHMHELHDKTKDGGRQQKIMAKMGWFSPVLYTASKAHPMVVPKTLYSPARACLSFNHSHSDVQDVLLACQKLPADRAFSETDLPLIHQTLSQLDK